MEQSEFTRAYQKSCLNKLTELLSNMPPSRVAEAANMINSNQVTLYELPEILTTDEIAKHLRVHIRSVGGWIRSGKLKAFKAGHSYRVNRVDLIEFLTKKQVQ